MNSSVPNLDFVSLQPHSPKKRSPRPEELPQDPRANDRLTSRLYTRRPQIGRENQGASGVSRPLLTMKQELNPQSHISKPHSPAVRHFKPKTPRVPLVTHIKKSVNVPAPPVRNPISNIPQPQSSLYENSESEVEIRKDSSTPIENPKPKRIKRDLLNEIPSFRPKEIPIEESSIMIPGWDDIEERESFLNTFENDPRFKVFKNDPTAFLYAYPVCGNHFNLRIIDSSEIEKMAQEQEIKLNLDSPNAVVAISNNNNNKQPKQPSQPPPPQTTAAVAIRRRINSNVKITNSNDNDNNNNSSSTDSTSNISSSATSINTNISNNNPIIIEDGTPTAVDYYVITHNAIMHCMAADTMLTTLEQYEIEYHMFYRVRRIKFFRYFKVVKAFEQWKHTVRRNNMMRAAKQLNKQLFILDNVLRDGLFQFIDLFNELSALQLYHLDPINTYTLDEFDQVQNEQRENSEKQFHNIENKIKVLLLNTCSTSLNTYIEDGGFGKTSTHPMKSSLTSPTHGASPLIAALDNQINEQQANSQTKEISFTKRAAMRSQCRKLANYIRLIDFMVLDRLLNLSLDSTKQLLNGITEEGREVLRQNIISTQSVIDQELEETWQPLFSMTVLPNQTKIDNDEPPVTVTLDHYLYTPTPEQFKMKVESLVYEGLKIITNPNRLLVDNTFIDFVQPLLDETNGVIGEGLDLSSLVVENVYFQSLIDKIGQTLTESFDKAIKETDIFLVYLQGYVDCAEDYKHMTIEEYKTTPIETYTARLDKYNSQSLLFNDMEEQHRIGIIRLEILQMKDLFIPVPRDCHDKISELMPMILKQKSKALLEEVSHAQKIVTTIPISVDEFVSVTSFTRECQEKMGDIDDEYNFCLNLNSALEQYEIFIEDDIATNLFMLNQTLYSLKTGLSLAEGKYEENTRKFSKELDEEIPKLHVKISDLAADLSNAMISKLDSKIDDVLDYLMRLDERVTYCKKECEKIQKYQETLKLSVTLFDDFDFVYRDFTLKMRLWNGLQTWNENTLQWSTLPFEQIDPDIIGKDVQIYLKTALQAESGLPGNKVATKLKEMVTEFKSTLPVVTSLRCPDLKDRHWDRIHSLLGFRIHGVEGFTLGQLIEKKAMNHAQELETIATEAIQESVLEAMRDGVEQKWKNIDFEVLKYKDTNDTFILGSVDDIISLLEDSLVTMNTILGSRFVGPIRNKVDELQRKLIMLQKVLDEWLVCQKHWMYLENIFSAPDIQRQLPKETKLFQSVDKAWKALMKRCFDDPLCIRAGTAIGLLENLKKHNATLDNVQKSLEDYLEVKRCIFPRFYFLSNDELLEILSQTRDPHAVQPHLRKCFDNLVTLKFGTDPGSIDITDMISSEGEVIPLGKNLKARGNVEDWLSEVEKNMRMSLQKLMGVGLKDYVNEERPEWVLDHAGQIVATVAQIMWCSETEKVLTSGVQNAKDAMKEWYDHNVKDLKDLTKMVRGELTKNQRRVIVALVTTDVHARDIIYDLYQEGVSDISNFGWQKQLRYYWEDETVVARQSNSTIPYGYEYEGCTSRLVITPLTDRCWMTLTGALALKLGGNPAGPAGTGKTESSKDLAKALAILCIVFNCSDQIDYKMMGKLFAGLAQAGCWTCLDEFNRIDIEVLSVIAQQLLVLRQARLLKTEHLNFEGRQISMNGEMHVIITMNPGYAGRTELPDNLKVLFRPVAMMVPDYSLIAEIMLFAEGFDDAKNLSRKMTKLYKLSSEQLSQQCHYDYGLRAVKSVLVMAGGLKRNNPDLSEDVVLIRAMRDSNVPKFLSDDLPLFYGILQDLFPGVEVPYQDTGKLREQIDKEQLNNGLQVVEAYSKKIIQLYETMDVRFGVVLVGPSGSGKSTAEDMLADAMTHLFEEGNGTESIQIVEKQVINPKCITMGELYGEYNELTQQWIDGLASTIMRKYALDESPNKKWLIFDGPIDALWIENMNTVLDDNMTLCLANGERIKLKPQMRMVFEVGDLEAASPATVSRLGVVYVPVEDIGWLPYIQTWLVKSMSTLLSEEESERFLWNVETFIPETIDLIRNKLHEPIKTLDQNLVISLCAIFQSLWYPFEFVPPEHEDDANRIKEEKIRMTNQHLDQIFSFAFIWSFGITINPSEWMQFDEFYHQLMDKAQLDLGYSSGLVYDYYLKSDRMEFKDWSTIVPSFTYAKVPYFELFVPTVDTTRYSYFLTRLLQINKPVFFTGVTGTGKTVILESTLNDLKKSEEEGGQSIFALTLGFSARTDSKVTQMTIESNLQKQRKNYLSAPPPAKKVVIAVDDVNMPAVETYGAQPPIELLRQFLTWHGFYDRKQLFWKEIANTNLVAAAAPPGGGRSALTQRFMRHFNLFCLPPSSADAMDRIFNSIITGFFADFVNEIKVLNSAVVNSTIEIYQRMSENLRPTPAKSHYTFNLRDISKIFQGILMIEPKFCSNAEVMQKLWIHETMRVFYDRLINNEDKEWFIDQIQQLLQRYFHVGNPQELFGGNPIIFGDFLRIGTSFADKKYEEIKDIGRVSHILRDYLDEYNLDHSQQMNLVFFNDAIDHISHILRIIRQPRGNAMLVGVGGSGKQSLTRLACFISDLQCSQIEITRGYNLTSFREDLKNLMVKTGVQNERTVFLFTDSQIMEESFLEDINAILNTGEVPNLFAPDEMEKVLTDMVPVMRELGLPQSRDLCKIYFVKRVRDNLHLVLCMSPVGDSLRIRCRQFPSLINCTTIDWYLPWPDEALKSVAEYYLGTFELEDEKVKESLVNACVHVHLSIADYSDQFFNELRRKVYTTPKSYLDMIELYGKLLKQKKEQFNSKLSQLELGITKLRETNELVEGLRKDLTALAPVLDVKSKETEELLAEVAKQQEEASEVRERVAAETADVSKQQEEVAEIQAEAERDLNVALPALRNAEHALEALDKKDISEMKSFKTPPAAVQIVMEAVCILLGDKPDWETAKKWLSKTDFLQLLQNFAKDDIKPPTLIKLKKYIENPNMQPDFVQKISVAATSICLWVHAINTYAKVSKEVEPKRKRLEEMNKTLDAANAALAEKQAVLNEIEAKVNELQMKCDQTVNEKKRLQGEIELTRKRLERAEKLTKGLEAEGVRWKEQAVQLSGQIKLLVGDVFVSSASLSYYGAFTGLYRDKIVDDWLNTMKEGEIPLSENYSLMNTLGNPVQTQEWQIQGLPTDTVSVNNSILATQGSRWPLMIDPQGQANKWIRNWHGKNLDITKIHDINLLRTLENCIRVGRILLIEDIGEQLVASLEPVLTKQIHKQGGRLLIHLGDSDVDYDNNFLLFLTTKLPNPHYLPEVCIKVNIINFTVTLDGLEDQLLGLVVKKEASAVEEKRVLLVSSMAADRKQLESIQNNILSMLSAASGNILDDELLINTLAESQKTGQIIAERVTESQKTEVEINTVRDEYRPVALRGSLIYFVISDLSGIDPMYQNSLVYFNRLFNMCIDESEKSDDIEVRLNNIIEYMTKVIYRNICRGLFEKDKLLFSFLICITIMRNKGIVSDNEWFIFLRGPSIFERANQPPNPNKTVFSDIQWDTVYSMELEIPNFENITTEFTTNLDKWLEWSNQSNPEELEIPSPWKEKITPFQFLLLLKVFREDRVVFAVSRYISSQLGSHMVETPSTSMEEINKDMDKCTPCIFVLSTGADPTSLLLQFAERRQMTDRMHVISLGQGQGPKAEALVNDCSKKGDWVLLQNCHLAKSWMPELEKMVLSFEENKEIDDNFRLFLTSFPAEYFPVPVLQCGVKLTTEPPKGLKSNILRSYETIITEQKLGECSKTISWHKLLFGLGFFHAIIQERRKFGPLGWNILYEFNDSDLDTSIEVLKMFLNDQEVIPWDALRYVIGQINYGGRVTDDWDRRCLMSILDHYINPSILDNSYKFSNSGIYYAPEVSDHNSYLEYIKSLPMNEDPEIFGMHFNASIAYRKQEAFTLVTSLFSIQPRTTGSGSGGKSNDDIVYDLATEIESLVPNNLSKENANKNTFVIDPVSGLMNSLATVLSQEIVKFNRLIDCVRSSLIEIKKAIRGLAVMSEDMDKMYVSFLGNQVPEIWHNVAYPSLKPLGSWVKDLVVRVEFMRKWINNGPPNAFPLPVFFFPQGFMTGVLQVFSRKYKVPINSLDFSFSFYKDEPLSSLETPEDGVIVYGLWMEGARWDLEKSEVVDSKPGELYCPMIPIHFLPTKNYEPNEKEYACPVYKTSQRAGALSTTGISTNYVVTVYLPTSVAPDTWIWKGCAFLCNLND